MCPPHAVSTMDMRDMTNGTEISTSFETDEIAEKSESHDVSFNDNRQEIRHPRRPAKVSQHCRGKARAVAVRGPVAFAYADAHGARARPAIIELCGRRNESDVAVISFFVSRSFRDETEKEEEEEVASITI